MQQTASVFRSAAAGFPLSRNRCRFNTKNAAIGRTPSRIYFSAASSTSKDSLAPSEDPAAAIITDGTARRKFTSPFRIKRAVARVVPQAEDSLLVAIAIWAGSPANR